MNTIDKKGWKKVMFGEVCSNLNVATQDPNAMGIDRYIGLEHIETGNLRITSWGNVVDGTTFTKTFKPGHVLFGKRRAYLKKAAVADFNGLCSSDILVFETDEKMIERRLLPFVVSSDRFFEYAVQTSAGSLSPRTKFQDLAKFEFMLPPKEQQASLAELLWAADEVVQQYYELKRSQIVTLNAFFEIVYKEKSLKYLPLGQCLEFSQYGISEQLSDVGDIPVLRMNNLQNKKVVMNDLKYILRSTFKNPESLLLKKGDILFNRTNSYELVGKVGLFDLEREVSFASYLIRLRANNDIILPEYLNSYLNSEKGQAAIRVHRTPGVSQSNINVENLKKIAIPIVSKNVQLELIKKIALLESAMQETDAAIKSVLTIYKQLINKIFSA